ncbi:hypothetical protein MRX96_047708 [Rhipicephalus microplus]
MRSRPLMVEYCAGMWTYSLAGRSGLPKRRVQNWKDRSLKDDRCQRLPLKARVLSRWPLKARVRPLWSQTHLGGQPTAVVSSVPPTGGRNRSTDCPSGGKWRAFSATTVLSSLAACSGNPAPSKRLSTWPWLTAEFKLGGEGCCVV